jgi:hypothetical protein
MLDDTDIALRMVAVTSQLSPGPHARDLAALRGRGKMNNLLG